MMWISAYGCVTAAGTTSDFWPALQAGRDHSRPLHSPMKGMPETTKSYAFPVVEPQRSQRETLLFHLNNAWQDALSNLSPEAQIQICQSPRLGLILASTKGFIDDVIWTTQEAPEADTVSPLLLDFARSQNLQPVRTACVSNACTSTLAGLHLAERWLRTSAVTDVILLAADAVGPFVLRGFQSLKVLTSDKLMPFGQQRSGFYLGEATAAFWLTQKPQAHSYRVAGVAIDAEGYAVTRPSQSGASLQRAVHKVLPNPKARPDFILAHGTATPTNDAVEDAVFYETWGRQGQLPPITCTKWSVGHTLAVSGALDLIAGCESLRRQRLFGIANTVIKDPVLRCSYLFQNSVLDSPGPLQNFMVTSLGFGGVHAAAWIERS